MIIAESEKKTLVTVTGTGPYIFSKDALLVTANFLNTSPTAKTFSMGTIAGGTDLYDEIECLPNAYNDQTFNKFFRAGSAIYFGQLTGPVDGNITIKLFLL